jgi:hypothetical protein
VEPERGKSELILRQRLIGAKGIFNIDTGKARQKKKEDGKMIWTILVILLVLWLLGFIGNVAGSLIHLLLVVAAVVLVVKLVPGRRAA